MRFTTHKRRRAPAVIIVSLIDVLLVVMIFLMVSTTFRLDQPSLKLALPESKTAQTGASDVKPMVITIASNAPHFFIADRPITMDGLQRELTAATRRDPQLKVAIRADRKAPFGEVTRVIDAAKEAKVGSLNFYMEKPLK